MTTFGRNGGAVENTLCYAQAQINSVGFEANFRCSQVMMQTVALQHSGLSRGTTEPQTGLCKLVDTFF